MSHRLQIALVGNPNSGKSSLFNMLTGLNQRVGNYPGVTVDKKSGTSKLTSSLSADIIDLPGTYSLYPKSEDEKVTCGILLNPHDSHYPDGIILVADASNLKRNLLFCTQIMDLQIPVIIVLTMIDIAKKKGITIDKEELERQLGVPVITMNARRSKELPELKKMMAQYLSSPPSIPPSAFLSINELTDPLLLADIQRELSLSSPYAALQLATGYQDADFIDAAKKSYLTNLLATQSFSKGKIQAEEVMQRYQKINAVMQKAVVEDSLLKKELFSERIDKWLLHPLWGNLILLIVVFILFQSIFWLANYPMDWVEHGFHAFQSWVASVLPDSAFADLIVNGLLAGLGGIAIFIPQIMILFGLITILEDSGYMARISFLTDKMMRNAGLNGRSMMPLIGGMACAVPAIMSARTIQNKKERLITIMVTPLMSCSARLPVYAILIDLVIPDKRWLGFFNLHGLIFTALYLMGFVMAIVVAKVFDMFIKNKGKSYFIMELPVYKMPRWKNVLNTMIEKARIFITDAGKVIIVISLVLWTLASYGPSNRREQIQNHFATLIRQNPEKEKQWRTEESKELLNNSYAGILGKTIEPIIAPLGYDWKIGIAIITSFAAREVFVGTMATLYSVGEEEPDTESKLRDKMKQARRSDGTKVYTLATGVSLLVFYAFAMQCMSTLAITRRETKSWKWPALQLAYLSILAYGASWITYQLLS